VRCNQQGKNIMAKAYIIIHDGKNVLVGTGGRSGNPPKQREGYHLPGGTVLPLPDPPTDKPPGWIELGKKQPGRDVSPSDTVERELEEETGIKLGPQNMVGGMFKLKGDDDVTILMAKVPDVKAYVDKFQQPTITNQHDEPFDSLVALPIGEWGDPNFSTKYSTNWFGTAIYTAWNEGRFKK
jgi:8-oxo-dGTP pyrophosphatase MutT (NUDIX family)